jgi:hypothetical protein
MQKSCTGLAFMLQEQALPTEPSVYIVKGYI